MALAQMRNLISQRKGRFLRLSEKDLDATGAAKDEKLTAEIHRNDQKRPSSAFGGPMDIVIINGLR
jgi:hypothetical protein